MEGLKNATYKSKDSKKLPKGAKILSKEINVTVEEIENGYLIVKNCDIKFSVKDRTDYMYYTKKMFSEDNPIQIKEDKMLADYFDV